jgi:hypothetical protein
MRKTSLNIKYLFLPLFFLLFITPAFGILNTPTLTAPFNNSTNNQPNELLDWGGVTGATGYEYKLSTDPGLAGASAISVSGTSQANTANLLFGTVYYWRVRALKTTAPIDSSLWSTIWSFTTVEQLTLLAPFNASLFAAPNEQLDW